MNEKSAFGSPQMGSVPLKIKIKSFPINCLFAKLLSIWQGVDSIGSRFNWESTPSVLVYTNACESVLNFGVDSTENLAPWVKEKLYLGVLLAL